MTAWVKAAPINGCNSSNASADDVGVRFHWNGTIFIMHGR